MRLSLDDVHHLHAGALFNAPAVDHAWCAEEVARVLAHMEQYGEAPELLPVESLDPDDLVVSIGYVNKGHPIAELRPVGDEFVRCVELIEASLGQQVAGVMPLAAGNVNAISPLLPAIRLGLPVIDADPMGRIFPLVDQTVFTLKGLSVGPVAAVGALGESALFDVERPARGDKLLRAAADEFGGWAASATYPMTASTLAESGVIGSLSRLIRIGRILNLPLETDEKYDALRRSEGVKQIIRTRIGDTAWASQPARVGRNQRTDSVVLLENSQGRLVQLEVEDELLMLLVDGSVRAAVPDIITMLQPEENRVAELSDLWAGNSIDIVVMRAAEPWYTPEGMALAGPSAFGLLTGTAGKDAGR